MVKLDYNNFSVISRKFG